MSWRKPETFWGPFCRPRIPAQCPSLPSATLRSEPVDWGRGDAGALLVCCGNLRPPGGPMTRRECPLEGVGVEKGGGSRNPCGGDGWFVDSARAEM